MIEKLTGELFSIRSIRKNIFQRQCPKISVFDSLVGEGQVRLEHAATTEHLGNARGSDDYYEVVLTATA
jgi:hypothetical protein